ncbi:hypothetical protein FACS1894196_4000 [Clostridia bacterium]|nr:hypothetical protein FACS1894196_4000 [Clostridia bacterium]
MTNIPARDTRSVGLTGEEARRRLAAEGPNVLQSRRRVRPLAIFLSQFADFLTIILLMSMGLSLLLGDVTEAVTIIAIVALNALLGFLQEYKTERTIDALRNMAAPRATALRDGAPVSLPASEIVSGDVILIDAGDRVPADAELAVAFNLRADESLLTGESVPAEKSARGRGDERRLFMGTLIAQGHARAVATATGMRTEMGRIAGMLGDIEEPQTPLQKRLDQLGRTIAIGCLCICAVVSVTGVLRGEDPLQMIIMGVSLSVAAVPEGLSAIVTIALALAVGRMVRRKALIRKLHAVETLGCASVICTDKTGTLTENKMTVRAVHTAQRALTVTGEGYDPRGRFLSGNRAVNPLDDPCLSLALTSACLCNNAALPPTGDPVGDPTEIALLVAAQKANLSPQSLAARYQKTGELPFDSDRKRMSVLTREGRHTVLFAKGAPDVLVDQCAYVYLADGPAPMTPALRASLLSDSERLAASALRVLGVAYRRDPRQGDPEADLTFLALVGMMDPPRQASYDAVRVCAQAGVKPVMVTGDHMVTARAIAGELGILRVGGRVLTGAQVDAMDDAALAQAARDTTVFARAIRQKTMSAKPPPRLPHDPYRKRENPAARPYRADSPSRGAIPAR